MRRQRRRCRGGLSMIRNRRRMDSYAAKKPVDKISTHRSYSVLCLGSENGIPIRLTKAMHWPTHGQWWSNLWTQLLQIEQWKARGGRYSWQVSQNFTLTVKPFTITSFVRGSFTFPNLLLTHSVDWVITSGISASGTSLFLGIIPGSLDDVKKRKVKACIKKRGKRSMNLSQCMIWLTK